MHDRLDEDHPGRHPPDDPQTQWATEDPAASNSCAGRGSDAGRACAARHRPRLELAAAAGNGRRFQIQDIATAEKVSDRFVSRMMRLAYLSPEVLDHLVIRRVPPALSLNDLVTVADRPWAEQMDMVFD